MISLKKIFEVEVTCYLREFWKYACDGHLSLKYVFQDFKEFFKNQIVTNFNCIKRQERAKLRDNLKQRNIYIKCKKENAIILLIIITKAKYNNWPNKNEKKQASKLDLLLKLKQTGRNSFSLQVP